MSSLVLVGCDGGEPFDAPGQLPDEGQLVFLLDASTDAPGAFARRQHDVRNALDRNGTIIFLLGSRIAGGLATQFGCWIRAKIGLDIVPWTEPREIEPALVAGGRGNAAIRFFSGDLPSGATPLARGPSDELTAVRFRAGPAEVIVAPAPSPLDATNLGAQLKLLH
jgi:hypothetical protein